MRCTIDFRSEGIVDFYFFSTFKGLVAVATLFIYFCLLQSHTFIITFVQYTHPSPFAEASLRFLHCFRSAEKTSWGAEPGFELGPAVQRPARYQLS